MLHALALAVAGGGAAFLAVYGWRRRRLPGGTPFALAMGALALWALASALELVSPGLSAKILWSKLQYVGVVSVAPLWLVFALEFTRRKQWLTAPRALLLWAVPLAVLALVWTNEWHGLVWTRVTLASAAPGAQAIYHHGPAVWVNLAYSYSLLIVGTALMAAAALRMPRHRRLEAALLLTAVVVPWASNVLYMIGVLAAGLDLTPFAFAVSGALVALGALRFNLLGGAPVTHRVLLETMGDGVIVSDAAGHVVDINPAGRRLLSVDDQALGQDATVVMQAWPGLAGYCLHTEEARAETLLDDGVTAHWLDVRVSPVRDRRAHLRGRVVVLRDITARRHAEEALHDHARCLAALLDASHLASDSTGLSPLLEGLARCAAAAVDGLICIIYELRDDGLLAPLARFGPPDRGPRVRRGRPQHIDDWPPDGRAIREGTVQEVRLSEPSLTPATRSVMVGWGEQTVVSVPARHRGETVGLLKIVETERERHLAPEEVDLLRAFGEQAAVAIALARAEKQCAAAAAAPGPETATAAGHASAGEAWRPADAPASGLAEPSPATG